MALTLSVGFVVDDAIVMLENIVRHMEMGKTRMQAALDGAKEIGFTIVSMTLSLAAVFIPVLFMGGLVGRLFREFSVTIGVAVLVSGFVSLTLTPMLSSRFLRDPRQGPPRPGLPRHRGGASRPCCGSTAGPCAACCGTAGLTHAGLRWRSWAATVYLFIVVPKGFIPSEDRDQIMVSTEAAQDISFDAHGRRTSRRWPTSSQDDPNVERFMCRVGGGGHGGGQQRPHVRRPQAARASATLSADQVIERAPPQAGGRAGHPGVPDQPAADQHRRPACRRASTSSPSRAPTPTSCTSYAAELEEKIRGHARACRTSPATCS